MPSKWLEEKGLELVAVLDKYLAGLEVLHKGIEGGCRRLWFEEGENDLVIRVYLEDRREQAEGKVEE